MQEKTKQIIPLVLTFGSSASFFGVEVWTFSERGGTLQLSNLPELCSLVLVGAQQVFSLPFPSGSVQAE